MNIHYDQAPRETLTKDAAKQLARRIEAYWRARGYVVNVRAEPMRESYDDKVPAYYQVRSDMIGGLPRVR